ncbi:Cactin [Babesia sp. Xinjiang]|uniref:Cactin n=1 Tax=Babesia sp. Xinjiang TaxID=462227 RepID=UPI000A22CAB4|nr:Cactin [Babesia sp. Xinjiang]ORM41279.1 Cactin [Babesia sp. Xinjiang]
MTSTANTEASESVTYHRHCGSHRCPRHRRTDSESRFLNYIIDSASSPSGELLDEIIRVQLAQPSDNIVWPAFASVPSFFSEIKNHVRLVSSFRQYAQLSSYSWDVINTIVLIVSSASFLYIVVTGQGKVVLRPIRSAPFRRCEPVIHRFCRINRNSWLDCTLYQYMLYPVFGTSNFMAVRLIYTLVLFCFASAIFRHLPAYVSGEPVELEDVERAATTKKKMVCFVASWPLAALIPQIICAWWAKRNPIEVVPLRTCDHKTQCLAVIKDSIIMRGIPANGPGSNPGAHNGSTDPSEARSNEGYNKATTATFRGLDGKKMIFVVVGSTDDTSSSGYTLPREQSSSKGQRVATSPLESPREVISSDIKVSKSIDLKRPLAAGDSNSKKVKVTGYDEPKSHITHSVPIDASSSDDYIKKEDEFMLKQELEKSKLRLKDGRGNELDHLLASDASIGSSTDLFKDAEVDVLHQYLEHLKARLHFCKDNALASFLRALETIVKTRLAGDFSAGEVSETVSAKIDSILSTKSISELEGYEVEIEKKLNSDGVVDTSFWELALSRIPFFKACSIVHDYKKGLTTDVNTSSTHLQSTTTTATSSPKTLTDKKYERFMQSLKLDSDEHIVREHVPYGSSTGPKPFFAARVTLSYDWNTYNLIHYDVNNPPPKSVQGFKFSIFYSGLEDPRSTPQWKLVKDGTSKDTCLLVFKGGRPYAPIAFRIPSREWDTDPSRGFKNCFSDGVLHLCGSNPLDPSLRECYLWYADALLTKEEQNQSMFSSPVDAGSDGSLPAADIVLDNADSPESCDESLAFEIFQIASDCYANFFRLCTLKGAALEKEVLDASYCFVRMGDMFYANNQFDEAANEYERAIEMRRRYTLPERHVASLYLSFAQCQMFGGQLGASLRTFMAAKEILMRLLVGNLSDAERQRIRDTIDDVEAQLNDLRKMIAAQSDTTEQKGSQSNAASLVPKTTGTFDKKKLDADSKSAVINVSENDTGAKRRIDISRMYK